MRLSGLVPLIDELPEFQQLVQAIAQPEPTAAVAPGSSAVGTAAAEPGARSGVPALAVVREAAKPYVVAGMQRRLRRPIVLVAADGGRAQEWYHDLLTWSAAPETVLHFPAYDALPFERLPTVPEVVAARAGTLVQLSGDAPGQERDGDDSLPYLVVTSAQALTTRLTSPADFGHRVLTLRVGKSYKLDDLLRLLAASGFERAGLVEMPGSYSHRGGILDIFPPLAESPMRLEFFGDELESIRFFDPATQRSTGTTESVLLAPATELPLWHGQTAAAALRALDWTTLRPEIREEWEWQVRDLDAGAFFSEAPFYAGYLIQDGATLLDYLPDAVIVLDEPQAVYTGLADREEQARELREKLSQAGTIPHHFQAPHVTPANLEARLAAATVIHLSYRPVHAPVMPGFGVGRLALAAGQPAAAPDDAGTTDANVAGTKAVPGRTPSGPRRSGAAASRGRPEEAPPNEEGEEDDDRPLADVPRARVVVELASFDMAPTYGGRIKDVVDATRAKTLGRQRPVLVSQQASRLAELYADRGVTVRPLERLERAPERSTLSMVHGQLGEGWTNNTLGVFLLTDTEIFGWAKPRRVIRRRRIARESFLTELKPGDFVVHIEHGIAQFQGMVKRRSEAGEREYLLLQFAGNDRVYVPTDQLDRVDRYIGVGDHTPALSKLGGAEWERAKNRVKQSVAEVAKALLDLYSERELATAEAVSPDNEWQRELEEAFPYVETPDQMQAIEDVKRDLEQPKPMDRLICGDVGFGKTEVAVRAAFKMVQDGKQVAVLVPTTVLAQQHFRTFQERMQAFPVTVELLSRFRSPKEQTAVVEGLRAGSVDIVIGTHRLLGKDVKFKDIGLLVIDEEHRFGVLHKEKLKQIRVNVHVLTLTATPIPRTLHTSLVGLRDMSVIETHPEARLPIKTYVTGTNDDLIREAVLREVDRGGQVYFVHNRVQSIQQVARKLGRLIPEVDITVGHGQMDDDALEKVMMEFSQGSHDVLVCTTIIESGLDIPNVNTIILNDAGNFGLAQLYQLRGRVGRGGNQAYAYLLYEPNRRLTEPAEKRLRTIFEATDLGAGFKIAMKDLEIRGAGNLLGPEQSGFMNTVGFDLYCRLLAQAVDEMRGKRTLPAYELVLDLPLGAHLPDDYIGDHDLKVRLYRRMANLATETEIDEAEREFGDRFGHLPPPVQDMFYLLRVKMLAKARYLRGIETQGLDLVVKMSPFVVSDRLALYKAFGTAAVVRSGQIKIPRPAQPERWKADLLKLLNCLRVVEPKRADGPGDDPAISGGTGGTEPGGAAASAVGAAGTGMSTGAGSGASIAGIARG